MRLTEYSKLIAIQVSAFKLNGRTGATEDSNATGVRNAAHTSMCTAPVRDAPLETFFSKTFARTDRYTQFGSKPLSNVISGAASTIISCKKLLSDFSVGSLS